MNPVFVTVMTCNVEFDRFEPSDVIFPKHTMTLLGAETKACGKLIAWFDVPAVTDIVLLPPWWDTDYKSSTQNTSKRTVQLVIVATA